MSAFQVWTWRQLAAWSMVFNRADWALRCWERIRAARPRDAAVLASLASLYAGAGCGDRALGLLRESLQIDAGLAYVHFNVGYLLQESEQHAQALIAFEHALTINSELDQAHYGRALSLIKLDRLADSVDALRRNIELQPLSPYGYYQLAHVYARLGRVERARSTIDRLRTFEPQLARRLQRELDLEAKGGGH